jgi:GT2 family glycosyltransferase
MNWILTLTKDNLALTKEAIRTFRAQDIGDVKILVIDNESKDSTPNFLNSQPDLFVIFNRPWKSVAASWNQGLNWLFNRKWADGNTPLAPMADYALVVNNDVELRPDTYRRLVEDGGEFVTAVGTRDPSKIGKGAFPFVFYPPEPKNIRPHPDFSCFLIRRTLYHKVGAFDEHFTPAFCEDGDYDLRMYKAGIRAYCLDLPFLHHGSATVKNASADEARRICKAADRNREYFKEKWGFEIGSEKYYKALDKGGPSAEPEVEKDMATQQTPAREN